jgi:carboxyl-terminal processing protease
MARRLLWLPVAATLFVIPLGRSFADDPPPPSPEEKKEREKAEREETYELFRLFTDTFDQVERNYVKDVSRRELMEAAIRGLLEKLDPYSNYISPDEMTQFRTSVEQEFGGIGIQVDMRDGQLIVVSPLYGTPAHRAGIHAGDAIVEVNGEPVTDTDVDTVIGKLKGEPGTTVSVTVSRAVSNKRETMELTREVVQLETILGDSRKEDDSWDFMLDHEKHIGYIRLSAFANETSGDLQRALEELTERKMAGLVLDLRFNGGGLLTSAIEISDLFIEEGRIVSTKGRNSEERVWEATKAGTFSGFPMAVITNRFSASASEIVAGCLQDHERAIIVGERTFGKGSVQNVIELEGGHSALKLTTAGYLRPSGKNIDRPPGAAESEEWGVMPNDGYAITFSDREMRRMVEDRRRRDIIHWRMPAEEGGEPNAPAPDEDRGEPFEDRQLGKALEFVRAEIDKKKAEEKPVPPMG